MERYSEYKSSGVEWIGEIPSHWERRKVSTLGTFFKGSGIKKDEVREEGFPCIRYGEIYTQYDRVVVKTVSFIDEETKRSSVPIGKGDVLFTGSGETVEDIGKSVVYFGEEQVYVSGDIIVLRLTGNELDPLFMSYLMNTDYVNHQKSLSGRGEIIVHIYSKNIREIQVFLPPLSEQEEIVRYLDTKTQEIDQLVSITQKKIDLLKERRTSIINEVVTKGLNPNVELKDSGVEWIGEIPSHWVRTRLRNLGEFFGGLSGKGGDDFKQDDNPKNRPYIPYTNILRNTYISKGHFDYVVMEEGEVQNRVQKYDMFFLMSSETHEDLGKSSILIEEVEELYLNSFCKGFRINKNTVFPLFLNYQLLGQVFKELVSVEGKGFTRINLRQDRLKDVPVLLPPLPEQEEIVRHLDTKTQEIDQLVSIEEKRIETLKEYRQSLISEVVTGKVKVTSTEPIYQEG